MGKLLDVFEIRDLAEKLGGNFLDRLKDLKKGSNKRAISVLCANDEVYEVFEASLRAYFWKREEEIEVIRGEVDDVHVVNLGFYCREIKRDEKYDGETWSQNWIFRGGG